MQMYVHLATNSFRCHGCSCHTIALEVMLISFATYKVHHECLAYRRDQLHRFLVFVKSCCESSNHPTYFVYCHFYLATEVLSLV